MNNKTYEDEIIEFEKEKNKIQNELDDYKNQLYKKFNVDDYVYLPDKIWLRIFQYIFQKENILK